MKAKTDRSSSPSPHRSVVGTTKYGAKLHPVGSISGSDLVRKHAFDVYLSPARRSGSKTFSINVGAVHRALGLNNRVPLVCAALASKKFLAENHLRLTSKTGPPSGQSTTVTFTYQIVEDAGKPAADGLDVFLALRGIGKETFASLGGGEAFLRRERAEFSGAMDKREAEGVPPKR
jgi:hypothetical protein